MGARGNGSGIAADEGVVTGDRKPSIMVALASKLKLDSSGSDSLKLDRREMAERGAGSSSRDFSNSPVSMDSSLEGGFSILICPSASTNIGTVFIVIRGQVEERQAVSE